MHGVRPVGELVDLARRAEYQGAEAVLLADEGLDRDLYVTLTAIGLATSRIALVPAITNPHSRHLVTTAAALASLAEVAPGRVVAGLGTGGSLVFGPMDLAPARPFTALAETVEVIDALLAGRAVDHDGEFRVVNAQLPWSAGALPVALAGRGPRVEALAASRADWVILAGKIIDDLPALAAGLRERSDGGPLLAWNPAVAWPEEHVHEVRSHFTYVTDDMPAAWRARLGVGDDVVEALREAVASGGPPAGAHLVPQSVIDAFAITGTRAEVVTRLAEVTAGLRPDLVTFDLNEYSPAFVDELAALAADAGFVHSWADGSGVGTTATPLLRRSA